jgi:DNA-binding NarL/FixJ family response regulator
VRILLVDDDEAFRGTLRRLLTRKGRRVQVDEAADGEEALRRVATRRPDIVLMDLTMPRMNGIEAVRQLKVRWPALPVLILTVHDDPVYERTARAAGADGFLLKKTAGTALWPALAALIPRRSRSTGGARALFDSGPPVTVRRRAREDSPGSLGDRPDWQARWQPLQAGNGRGDRPAPRARGGEHPPSSTGDEQEG